MNKTEKEGGRLVENNEISGGWGESSYRERIWGSEKTRSGGECGEGEQGEAYVKKGNREK